MLILLAPIWLGPAMGAMSRAIGGASHVCACGMAMGKCGCTACARIAQQRLRDHRSQAEPVFKSTCDDDGFTPTSMAAPLCVLQRATTVPENAFQGSLPVPVLVKQHSRPSDGPPSPPPRSRLL
jgi:hypothetical protein